MSEHIEEPDTIRNELIDNGALSGGRMRDGWTREYIVKVKHAELIAGSPFSHPFREEIVRCRDCKLFMSERKSETRGCFEILHPAFCNKHITNTEPDGFCSWGERRES